MRTHSDASQFSGSSTFVQSFISWKDFAMPLHCIASKRTIFVLLAFLSWINWINRTNENAFDNISHTVEALEAMEKRETRFMAEISKNNHRKSLERWSKQKKESTNYEPRTNNDYEFVSERHTKRVNTGGSSSSSSGEKQKEHMEKRFQIDTVLVIMAMHGHWSVCSEHAHLKVFFNEFLFILLSLCEIHHTTVFIIFNKILCGCTQFDTKSEHTN